MASDEFLYQGVKPKCVQGRWLTSRVDRKQHVLLITQYASARSLRAVCQSIPLPENFTEHIIGRPVCIGCRENLYIIQYITERCKYLRFMLVDLHAKSLQLFEDGEKYFNRDFAAICPVECMITPELSQVLFRLPQSIMSSRKWSKMLSAKISTGTTDANGSQYRVENIRCESLRDRRNQAVAVDPRYANRIAHILVNSYCSKCNIMMYDLSSRKNVGENEHRLHNRQYYHEASSSEGYYFLSQCNADYCRSGDVLVLLCIVTSSLDSQTFVRLYMFNADSFHLTQFVEHSTQQMELKLRDHQLIVAIPSVCDQYVRLWALEKGHTPRDLQVTARLPMPLTLQALCRAVILHCSDPDSLQKLNLPPKLLAYVQFKTLLNS